MAITPTKEYMLCFLASKSEVVYKIADSWKPLSFYKSSDGGQTYEQVTATESASDETGYTNYTVAVNNDDYVKIVREGAGPV